jgi:hypothetical protein
MQPGSYTFSPAAVKAGVPHVFCPFNKKVWNAADPTHHAAVISDVLRAAILKGFLVATPAPQTVLPEQTPCNGVSTGVATAPAVDAAAPLSVGASLHDVSEQTPHSGVSTGQAASFPRQITLCRIVNDAVKENAVFTVVKITPKSFVVKTDGKKAYLNHADGWQVATPSELKS